MHRALVQFALVAGITILVTLPARPSTADDSAIEQKRPASSAAELRVTLNTLLQEHVFLAAAATGTALDDHPAELAAAAAVLDSNSMELSTTIGDVYGAVAQRDFLDLWREHIRFVLDYTSGLAAHDRAEQDSAVAELVQYTGDFGDFLNSLNPGLSAAAVAGLLKDHILTLKAVLDAQAARDPTRTYRALRLAARHMPMIANPITDAIVKQFPKKFAK